MQSGDPRGFPVLVQHGMIASIRDSHLFKRLVDGGASVISIARPGYGDSSPYRMKNIGEWGMIVSILADALGLHQFDVLGISSGAPYCYAIGHSCPGRARNLFILSGTPALYDASVQALWPYPILVDAALEEMQALARELFFSRLSNEDLEQDDVQDSMRNDCFGIAQDLRLRCMDWGFQLNSISAWTLLRHSRLDESVPFAAAEMTARMLPCCYFDAHAGSVHFSQPVLDDFQKTILSVWKGDFPPGQQQG